MRTSTGHWVSSSLKYAQASLAEAALAELLSVQQASVMRMSDPQNDERRMAVRGY